jgi:hypothetical protein
MKRFNRTEVVILCVAIVGVLVSFEAQAGDSRSRCAHDAGETVYTESDGKCVKYVYKYGNPPKDCPVKTYVGEVDAENCDEGTGISSTSPLSGLR